MAQRDQGLRQAGMRQAGDPGKTSDQAWPTKIMRHGVSGSTAHNTFDLVYPWGLSENWSGWGVSGGATDPIDVLNAFPHVFPIGCSIKDIILKNNVGAPLTKYKLGIYSNLGTGLVYPSTKLAEFVEQNPLAGGITTWAGVNLPVGAGSLLWIVHTCDNTGPNINLSSIPQSSSSAMVIMGIEGTVLTTDPICGWQMARTYDGTLPATYPTGAPTKLISTTHTMPAFFIRFA